MVVGIFRKKYCKRSYLPIDCCKCGCNHHGCCKEFLKLYEERNCHSKTKRSLQRISFIPDELTGGGPNPTDKARPVNQECNCPVIVFNPSAN